MFYDESPAAALEPFGRLARDVPERADVHYGLGRCLLAGGELEAARASIAKATELEPDSPELRFYLGVVDYQQENFGRAIRTWKEARPLFAQLSTSPLRRDYAWLLARALLEEGSLEEGSECFKEALKYGGTTPDGELNPPSLFLERTASGRLPGERFQPTIAVRGLRDDERIVFGAEGAIWEMSAAYAFRRRLTDPPSGWSDSYPTRSGDRLAYISTDPQGRSWLFLQTGDRSRQELVDTPVSGTRLSWSADGSLLAFAQLCEASQKPCIRIFSTAENQAYSILWPDDAATDPAFTPFDGLLLSTLVKGQMALAHLEAGARQGEVLKPFPLVDPTTPASLGSGVVQVPRGARPGSSAPKDDKRDSPKAQHITLPWETRAPSEGPEDQADSTRPLSPRTSSAESPEREGSRAHEQPRQDPPADVSPNARNPQPGTATEEFVSGARQPAAAHTKRGMVAYTHQTGYLRRICLRMPDLEQTIAITPETKDCYAPAFSEDDTRLLFVCVEKGVRRLYIHDLEEHTSTPVCSETLDVTSPFWAKKQEQAWE